MKKEAMNRHMGSGVDEFFAEEGLLEEIEAIAIKRVIALELQDATDKTQMTKTELARRLEIGRTKVHRILDPTNESIALNTLIKAAALIGKRLHVSLQAAKSQSAKRRLDPTKTAHGSRLLETLHRPRTRRRHSREPIIFGR
jgi:predicted DNA-binding protein (UPF0251 family)